MTLLALTLLASRPWVEARLAQLALAKLSELGRTTGSGLTASSATVTLGATLTLEVRGLTLPRPASLSRPCPALVTLPSLRVTLPAEHLLHPERALSQATVTLDRAVVSLPSSGSDLDALRASLARWQRALSPGSSRASPGASGTSLDAPRVILRHATLALEGLARERSLTDVDATLYASRGALHLRADARSVHHPALSLRASGSLSSPRGSPARASLSLATEDAPLEALQTLLPENLRQSLDISGPGSLTLEFSMDGRRSSFRGALELTRASVTTREFAKPRGLPFRVLARGALRPEVSLDEVSLQVVDATLTLRGVQRDRDGVSARFSLDAPALSSLAALSPRAHALRGLHGRLRSEGAASRGASGALSLDARWSLDRARISHARGSLQGDLSGALALSGDPALGALRASATLDASGAAVRLPGRFSRPSGRPLSLALSLHGDRARWSLDALTLSLDGARLALRGRYEPSSGRFSLRSPRTSLSLAPLARALPALRRASLPRSLRSARATLAWTLSGNVRRLREVSASLSVSMLRWEDGYARGFATRAPGAHGAVRLGVWAFVRPRTLSHIETQSEVTARASLVPVVVRAVVRPSPEGVWTVPEGSLALPGLELTGRATYDRPHGRITLDAPLARLDADRLRTWTASLPSAARGLRGHASLALGLPLSERALGELSLRDLALTGPFGDLGGSVTVAGLGPVRRVVAALTSERLDPGALLPRSPEGRPSAPRTTRARPLEGLSRLPEVHATWRVGALVAGRTTLRSLDAEADLARGSLALPRLRFELGGGEVDASGSSASLDGETPALHLRATTGWIDLATAFPPPAGEQGPTGQLQGSADLHASGLDADALRRSLRGSLELTGRALRVRPPSPPRVRFVNPRLATAMRSRPPSSPARRDPVGLASVHGRFRVEDGAFHTVGALEALSEFGAVRLTGTFALDGHVSLEGGISLSPAFLDTRSQGRLAASEPIPLQLRLQGTRGDLAVELTDLRAFTRSMLGAWLRALLDGEP